MAIEFRSVSKRFADGTLAVDDFSLVMPAHKTTVLVGSSGFCSPGPESLSTRTGVSG